jgi:hypothetical protein
MKYRQKLLKFIDSDDESDRLVDWIVTQPDLEQPDILRELVTLFQERYEKTGEEFWLEKKLFVEKNISEFEESILDDKLAQNLLITSINELDLDMDKVNSSIIKIREYIIVCVTINAENKEEMIELAKKVIAFEHTNGTYDPANWSSILKYII